MRGNNNCINLCDYGLRPYAGAEIYTTSRIKPRESPPSTLQACLAGPTYNSDEVFVNKCSLAGKIIYGGNANGAESNYIRHGTNLANYIWIEMAPGHVYPHGTHLHIYLACDGAGKALPVWNPTDGAKITLPAWYPPLAQNCRHVRFNCFYVFI